MTGVASDPGAALGHLRESVADTLGGIGNGPCALVDFPDHANVGDSAIWLGTIEWLRRCRAQDPLYVSSIEAFRPETLEAVLPEGPIFIHGGGNFGDLWPRHQTFRERLLGRFPGREIIQLPQSIHFGNAARADHTARAIARHGRFHLLVRDRWSFDFARRHFDCAVTLCPDMAFFLSPLDRSPASTDVLCLLRTDRERGAVGRPDRVGYRRRVADWLDESRLEIRSRQLASLRGSILEGRWDRLTLRAALYEAAARTRVRRGCRLLSEGRVVITDRLHAHILSLLLAIPHATLDNSYGKLGRFLDAWTGDATGVYRATSTDDAERWALEALAGAA